MLKLFLLLIAFAVGLTKQEEDILNFEVCPESHPIAFQFGQECCSIPILAYTSWSNDTCKGEAISCPASSCEDQRSTCISAVAALSSINSDIYDTIEYLEGNRPIYMNENNDTCIWWNKPTRHWWRGPCENVGTSSGNAYLQEDNTCPDASESTWINSDTDEVEDLSFQGGVGQSNGCTPKTSTSRTSTTK